LVGLHCGKTLLYEEMSQGTTLVVPQALKIFWFGR